MLQDIMALCRIDSEKGKAEDGAPFGKGPLAALELAMSLCEKYGFRVTNYDNYACAADLNNGERHLDMLAHLDVVPAQEGWTETEAFTPVIKGDRIFGRGTSDDKGPAVAALYAMRAVRELKLPVTKNVRLILGTDEENGSACIRHYYEKEAEAPMTFSPDGDFPVVNIEKGRLPGMFSAEWEKTELTPRVISVTGGQIENAVPPKAEAAVKGMKKETALPFADLLTGETGVSFSFTETDETLFITSHGRNAHASTPAEGKNGLTALLLLLTRLPLADTSSARMLRELYALMPYGETDGTSLGIQAADAESGALTLAFSQLAVTETGLKGLFDCRYPLCTDPETLVKTCAAAFEKSGMHFDGTRLVLPHHVPADSVLVSDLLKCYTEYTGKEGRCIAMGGGTYVHDLKNGVAFGAVFPGTDTRMHAPDEFAVIDELVMSAKMFAQVIADLCV